MHITQEITSDSDFPPVTGNQTFNRYLKSVHLATMSRRFLFLCLCISSSFAKSTKWDHCKCEWQNQTQCLCVRSTVCQSDGFIDSDASPPSDRIEPQLVECNSKNGQVCCGIPANLIRKTKPSCGRLKVDQVSNRIMSDDFTPVEMTQYPWLVTMFLFNDTTSKYDIRCWGTLIHPQVVMTTTHSLTVWVLCT